MSQIVLKGVSYSYSLGEGSSLKALKNLSFSVEKGEFVALAGMNGSGSSSGGGGSVSAAILPPQPASIQAAKIRSAIIFFI